MLPMLRTSRRIPRRAGAAILGSGTSAPPVAAEHVLAATMRPRAIEPAVVHTPVPAASFSVRVETDECDVEPQEEVIDWRSNCSGEDAWLRGPRSLDWWTGREPTGRVGSMPLPDLSKATREDLLEYFDNSWEITETLFASLQGEEAFFTPPYHDLRHPLIFYYGHPACFYVNKLRVAGLLDGPVHPYFESIFEVGVDEMRWDDLSKNHMKWPSVAEVHAYRKEVYQVVRNVIATHPGFDELATGLWDSQWWAIPMSMDHERIHIETSSVLMRELPLHFVSPSAAYPALCPERPAEGQSPRTPTVGADYPVNEMLEVEAGEVNLGKPHGYPSYGWDNEYGHKRMDVAGFAASKYMVSNGEFYNFVAAGGYSDSRFWSEDGWSWRTFRNVKGPTFWVRSGPSGLHEYKLRTVFEEVAMPWDWPAMVNYHEARAYCKWLTETQGAEVPFRIMTEAEHWSVRDHGRDVTLTRDPRTDPLMSIPRPDGEDNEVNFNFVHGSESPVDAMPASASGFHDVFGNAWEWCEDHQNPLPGFQVHPMYDDFTMPCFDGEHNMIMGGSFATTNDAGGRWARYQFRPHFFQHAGFRVVQPRSEPWLETSCMGNQGPFAGASNPFRQEPEFFKKPEDAKQTQADYENAEWHARYLHLHYPPAHDGFPGWVPEGARNFPHRCGERVLAAMDRLGKGKGTALDLGCGVGGSSFALAHKDRGFKSVTGVELSASFVKAAERMQREGTADYNIRLEGEQFERFHAAVPESADRSRVTFLQGDACQPDTSWWKSYDAVLVANVVCRLPNPTPMLESLSDAVNPGGVLMLTTPFSWKAEFTPTELWLGGQADSDVRSADRMREVLEGVGFELQEADDMSLTIRHHARFYELIGAGTTVWQRK